MRGDLTEAFKMLYGFDIIDVSQWFPTFFSGNPNYALQGMTANPLIIKNYHLPLQLNFNTKFSFSLPISNDKYDVFVLNQLRKSIILFLLKIIFENQNLPAKLIGKSISYLRKLKSNFHRKLNRTTT